MDLTANLAFGALAFARHTLGIMTKPYQTYRAIMTSGSLWELPFIALFVGIYFAFATLVKVDAFRIFLLTKQFILLWGVAFGSYMLVSYLLWFVGKKLGGTGSFFSVSLGWAYTLIPTVCWFLVTSILYIVLPPPRTTSIPGTLFSLLYLVFSGSLFFWKIVLMYLTLRFGQKMAFGAIVKTLSTVIPVLLLYSFMLYRLGIFRIPFL